MLLDLIDLTVQMIWSLLIEIDIVRETVQIVLK